MPEALEYTITVTLWDCCGRTSWCFDHPHQIPWDPSRPHMLHHNQQGPGEWVRDHFFWSSTSYNTSLPSLSLHITASSYSDTSYNLTRHICRFIFSSWNIASPDTEWSSVQRKENVHVNEKDQVHKRISTFPGEDQRIKYHSTPRIKRK